LYGCVESAKLWYEHIKTTLKAFGFKPNPKDICVFNMVGRKHGKQCTICIHVDDLMITCADEEFLEAVLEYIERVYKKVTIHRGSVHSYLGMMFDFSEEGKVKVTMEGYVNELLRYAEAAGVAASPAADYLFVIRDSKPLSAADRERFHSLVAKFLHLAKRVRPDILPVVAFLATRVQVATEDDLVKLERLIKYVNGTRELGIIMQPGDGPFKIRAYIDASYGVHADAKSHTGTFVCLGSGALMSSSKKQRLVTKSSSEAELVGLSDGATPVIHMRDFLIAQGYDVGPALIYQDNKSTIALAEKGRSTSERTRHINTRYFFVKDRIESGELELQYLPTDEMIADVLTKPLQGEKFRFLRNSLLNWH